MPTYRPFDFDRTQVPGAGNGLQCVVWTVPCAAAPSTSDPLHFGYIPANARVILATLEATDMDTNVSPTLTLNIGDAGSASRLFSASTVGQAGTVSTAITAAGAGYKYSAKTLITGVAANNAATGAAGSITLSLVYLVE